MSQSSITEDLRTIAQGGEALEAFRERWLMDELPADMPEWEKRRETAREYVTDILGIDRDG